MKHELITTFRWYRIMMRAIFLTHEEKAILDSCNLSVSCVLPGNREKYLTNRDAWQVNLNNYVLGIKDGVLSQFGFSNPDSDNEYYVSEADVAFIKEEANSFWCAECPTPDYVVLWPDHSVSTEVSNEEESEGPSCVTANSMLRRNLRTIVRAMSKVMSFKEVAASKQFELSVLND